MAAARAQIFDGADFGVDPLRGQSLHHALDAVRARGHVVPVSMWGNTVHVIAGFDDLHDAFGDEDTFPGGDMYAMTVKPVVGDTFINRDGESHDLMRRLATPAFRSRAISRFNDDSLVPLANEVLDGFVDRGEADLVAEFTLVLPYYAILRKLGLPRTDETAVRRWAEKLLSFSWDPEGAKEAGAEFTEFLTPTVQQRRRDAQDDVISALAHAEVDGRRFSDEEVVSHVRLLFPVGATTTSHTLGNLLYGLFTHPETLERVTEDRNSRAKAVHEGLRWEGPLGLLPRLVPAGATWRGTEIPPGSIVMFGIAAANHDPDHFDDPHLFDIDRPERDLLTFGYGQKYCPGAHLGRRETLTGLDVLLDRLANLRLADPEGSVPAGTTLRAPDALHVRWDV